MNFSSFLAHIWIAILTVMGTTGISSPPPSTPIEYRVPQEVTSTSVPAVPIQSTQAPATTPLATAKPAQVTTTATVASDLPRTGSPWLSSVPLGDSKYTLNAPKVGYIYLCHVQTGGGGAEGNPSWIQGSVWYPDQKVEVQGSVSWPNASYSMKVSGATRMITSNGLPADHPTGTFPIRSTDPAYAIDRNPNSVTAQSFSYSLPASPTAASAPGCIYGQVGIMNDGVPLFDGFDAEYRDAVAHETQDVWEGHPDVQGVYHNHGFENVIKNLSVSTVAGFAFDGFPITGPKLNDGTYLTTQDLDVCHGITSTITLDGKSVASYHYVLTQDFPYSVSCFKGKSYEPKPSGNPNQQETPGGQPVNSSVGTQSQMGHMPQQGGGQPPQEAISACSQKSDSATCSFATPNGSITGVCHTPPGQSSLACVPR